jgi:hypothetical protein
MGIDIGKNSFHVVGFDQRGAIVLRQKWSRGQIEARLTTQIVLDVLSVPQRNRRAGTYRRLAKVMSELGWTAVRVRGLTRGGYLEQVRGFARDGRSRQSFHHI